MKEVSAAGRTVLFVSHNIGVVRSLCKRGLLLSSGSIIFDDASGPAADRYLSIIAKASRQPIVNRADRSGRGSVQFIGVKATGIVDDAAAAITAGGAAEISLRINRWRQGIMLHLIICDIQGQAVMHCTPMNTSPADDLEYDGDGPCEIIWSTDELFLTPGSYRVDASLYRDGILEDGIEGLITFDVQPGTVRSRAFSQRSAYGSLALPHRWCVRAAQPTCVPL
jgi:lipopolysaccharide transport system ATP-binding protein